MGAYTGDPRNVSKTGGPSPASSAGANVATTTPGSFGSSKEGNVVGKGPNKAR